MGNLVNYTMQTQRLLTRGLLRAGCLPHLRMPRSTLERRFESTAPTQRRTVEIPACGQPPVVGAADNAFNRERAAIKAHAAWILWNEHWEHWEHMPPPSERPQYSYLNIRTRKFPWGDGNKVSSLSRHLSNITSNLIVDFIVSFPYLRTPA